MARLSGGVRRAIPFTISALALTAAIVGNWSEIAEIERADFDLELGVEAALILLIAHSLGVIRTYVGLSILGYRVESKRFIAVEARYFLLGHFGLPAVGAMVERSMILSGAGYQTAAGGALVLIERIIAMASLTLIVGAGALSVGILEQVLQVVGDIDVSYLALALLCLALSFLITAPLLRRSSLRLQPRRIAAFITFHFAASFLLQLLFTGGFTLVAIATGIVASPDKTAGAAAVVAGASSLPIAVSGWGVREMAAIAVFPLVGASAQQGFVAAIAFGLLSAVAVVATQVMLSLLDLGRPASGTTTLPTAPAPNGAVSFSPPAIMLPGNSINSNRVVIYFLTAIAVPLLFFNFYLSAGSWRLNVGLADPAAMAALGFLVVQLIGHSAEARMLFRQRTTIFLLTISAALIGAYVNGYLTIGFNSWATFNRLLGLLILFSYLSLGYLAAITFRTLGVARFITAFFVAALVIGCIDLFQTAIYDAFSTSTLARNYDVHRRISGFSVNRNAFSLLLLIVLALGVVLYSKYGGGVRRAIAPTLNATALGVLGMLIWNTQSRAAMLTFAAVLAAGLVAAVVRWQVVARVAAIAAVVAVAVSVLPVALRWVGTTCPPCGILLADAIGLELNESRFRDSTTSAPPRASTPGKDAVAAFVTGFPGSNEERLEGYEKALREWWSAPIFGIGLGVFYSKYQDVHGFPLIIHNTPLWILTEFGLLGFGAIGAAYLYLTLPLLAPLRRYRTLPQSLLLVTIIGVSVFAMAHEILYQRAIWFFLGLASAPLLATRSNVAISRKERTP